MKRNIYFLLILLFTAAKTYGSHPVKTIATEKINDANGVLTTRGDSVTLIGVVQSINFAQRGIEVSIFDGTGAIIVQNNQNARGYASATKGDKISVRGFMSQQAGLTFINPDSAITVVSTGNPLKTTPKVKVFDETSEGDYIELDSVTLVNPGQWVPGFQGYAQVTVNKVGTKQTEIILVSNTVINSMKAPRGIFSVKGVELQSDQNSPFFQGYFLAAFEASEYTIITSPQPILHKIAEVRTIDANGVGDSTKTSTYCYLKGIVECRNFAAIGYDFSLVDNTGAITVYSNAPVGGYSPSIGDSIIVRGSILMQRIQGQGGPPQNTGMIIIQPDSFKVLSANRPIIPAVTLTSPLKDKDESSLVRLTSVELKNPNAWDTTGKAVMHIYFHNQANDSFDVAIYKTDSLWYHQKLTKGTYSITGIARQRDNTQPFLQFYYIRPRYVMDIMSFAEKVSIKSVTITDPFTGKNYSNGRNVILQGVAESPTFINGKNFFAMTDNTGAIFVSSTLMTYTAKPGDEVAVRGIVGQANGLTIVTADSMGLVSSNHVVNVQNTLSTRNLQESDEAYLVIINGLHLKNPSDWDKTKLTTMNGVEGFAVVATDWAGDEHKIMISKTTDLFNEPAPTGYFNAYGIVGQDDPTDALAGYFLLPRSKDDIIASTSSINDLRNVKIQVYPNPAINDLNVVVNSGVTKCLSIFNSTGQVVKIISTERMNGFSTIDVSRLSPGIYTIRAEGGDKSLISTFVKE